MTSTFEDILREDGILTYTNVGVSMMPLLRQGKDLMVIEDVQNGRDIKMGRPLKQLDSVLFRRRNGQYVLHRIMDHGKAHANSTLYRICGDNTCQLEPVMREMIIGRLIAVDRGAQKGEKNNWHIDVESRGYRIYSWIMWGLWPWRRVWFPVKWKIKWVLKLPIRLIKFLKNGGKREKISQKLARFKKKH